MWETKLKQMAKPNNVYLEILLKYILECPHIWFLKEESPVNSHFVCCEWVDWNGDEIVLHVISYTRMTILVHF